MLGKRLKRAAALGSVCLTLMLSQAAHAVPTTISVDPTGSSSYSVTGVSQLDWESSGNIVIGQTLDSSNNGSTTLQDFMNNSSSGSTATVKLSGQGRLGDFLNSSGGAIPATGLSGNGGATGNYEVTAVLDGTANVTLYKVGTDNLLLFNSIKGTYKYLLDSTPDSNVLTGTGFNDGVPIMTGNLNGVKGQLNTTTGAGSIYMSDSIQSVDPAYVLAGDATMTSYDSTLKYITGEPSVGAGGTIGATPITIQTGDLILNSDASSKFEAVPEPATMLLLGSGLLGLARIGRRRISKK